VRGMGPEPMKAILETVDRETPVEEIAESSRWVSCS
jgi:hypothetical protein